MDKFESQGIFWPASEPESEVAGILEFDPTDGITLELIGSFKDDVWDQEYDAPGVIHGFLGDSTFGRAVTLYKIFKTGHQARIPGYVSERFHCNVGLLGGHVQQPEQTLWDQVDVEMSRLMQWHDVSGFTSDIVLNEAGKIDDFAIRFKKPTPCHASLDIGELFIEQRYRLPGSMFYDAHMSHRPFCRLDLTCSLGLDDVFERVVSPLQNMLTLGCDHANAIRRLTVTNSTMNDNNNQPLDLVVAVGTRFHENEVTDQSHASRMCFCFSDVQDRFDEFAKRWFQLHQKCRSAVGLFMSQFYETKTFVDLRFLSLINAAEAFHRQMMPGNKEDKRAHRERIDRIADNLDEGDERWVRQVLAYSNEKSQRDRLSELLDEATDCVAPLVRGDRAKFVKQIVSTRNYLVHRDERLKEHALTGRLLWQANQVLSYLLRYLLLHETGISNSKIKEIFERSERYLQLKTTEASQ